MWTSEEMIYTVVHKKRLCRVLDMCLRRTISEENNSFSTHMCTNAHISVFFTCHRRNMRRGVDMIESQAPELQLLCVLFTQIRRHMWTGEGMINTLVHQI
jgi:hypothetical protein